MKDIQLPKLSFSNFNGDVFTVQFANWDLTTEQMLQAVLGIMILDTWAEKQVLEAMRDFAEEQLEAWHPEETSNND